MSEKNQLLEGDLAQIIASYMRRIDEGESVDQQRILMDHPHLKAELESYFSDVALIESLAGPTASELLTPAGIDVHGETATFGAPVDVIDSEQMGNQKHAGGNQVPEGQFGRYQIEKILGQGAMGVVYLAYDMELERLVALKVPKIEEEEAAEELLVRFYREARAAATLRHRGICPIYDVGSEDGMSYIAMAYIAGMPLSSLIRQGKITSMRNISIVIRKLALAVESAHQNGVIHRDLKPANVIMDEDNEPVIMDFGLARQVNQKEASRLTIAGTIMGTPAYMSPEQVLGDIDSVGYPCDIYSLGVIFYELLTGGELPFQGPVVVIIGQIIGAQPSPPSSIKEGIDPELEAICLKMMAKKTEDRYQSMQEVVNVLTVYLKKNTKPTTDSPQPGLKLDEPQQTDKLKQPAKRRQPLTLFEKFNTRPPQTKAIVAAACASVLFLAAAITIFFTIGDQTVAVILDDPTVEVTIDGKHHVEFDGQIGHVDLEVGPHELTVTRGGAVIKVRVTKDGIKVKDQGEFTFTVEKNGKNLLEIKVLDQLKPPGKAVAATDKYRTTTANLALLPPRLSEILKQGPVGIQEFDFKREPGRDAYGNRFYHSGRMFIESSTPKKEVRAWAFAAGDGSGLVQVDVRTVEGSGWGVVFHSDILKRGFRITLEQEKLAFGPSIWEPGGSSPKHLSRVLTDKAPTKGVNQFDQLHVLIEGRTVTVFLNGEQCGTPVELDFDLGKHNICPGVISDKILTQVEFERILKFPLLENLNQTFKTADPRLIKILKQKPDDIQEFDFHKDPKQDGAFIPSFRDGRQIIESMRGNVHAAWPVAEHDRSGLVQIDVRIVEGCGWMVVFHNDPLDRGIRVEMRDGNLNFGPSIFGPRSKSITPVSRTLLEQPPTHGLNRLDRLHVLFEGQMVTVFLNGKQCGDSVKLDFDLGWHKVLTGAVNVSSKSITRVEYERVLHFALPENLEQRLKND